MIVDEALQQFRCTMDSGVFAMIYALWQGKIIKCHSVISGSEVEEV